MGKTVPPVAGAAAGTAANAALANDAGASATSLDDTAGKTRVPVTASAAGAAAASVTAVGADCCGPPDWENIGISILSDWSYSSKAESEITAVGGERVPLDGCSRRWRRACKGSPPRANGVVVSGGPDTLETGPSWQFISTSRCTCPCAMLFASPFTGGPARQAPLCSQSKLQKGRGRGYCCGAVLWPPLYLWSRTKLEKGRGAGCCCGDSAVPSPPL